MKQNETFDKIREWAQERGLYDKGDIKTQYCKLGEEFGELGRAIVKNDQEELIDSVGDIVITLINLTKLAGDHFQNECKHCGGKGFCVSENCETYNCDKCANNLKLEECIGLAYLVIKNRKGSMMNGTFVKE